MRLNLFDFLVKSATCFFAALCTGLALADQEQICDGQRTLFQCQVSGGKNVALCSDYVDGELSGIQYRFGRKTKKELVFPAIGFDFISFKYNHFIRYQTDYKRIKFSIGTYTYSLYNDYDDEKHKDRMRSAGILISSAPEVSDIELPCIYIYT